MKRVPELDGLRGLSAVVIMLFHLRFMNTFPLWGTAVDLFFVLSGYLITTILFETSGTEGALRNFYARRSLRILPIYYLSFPIFFLLNAVTPRPQPFDGIASFLTYTQFLPEYWSGAVPPCSQLYSHTWTLAIEEQFYLAWPLIVLASGRRFLLGAVVPLLAIPIVLRSEGLSPHLLLTRCDGLALGALLAWVLSGRERTKGLGRSFAAVFLAACAFPLWRRSAFGYLAESWPGRDWVAIEASINIARIGVAYFGLVGMVLLGSGRRVLAPLRSGLLRDLGRVSYGLYLYHPFAFTAVSLAAFKLGYRGSPLLDALKVLACYGFAKLSWRFVEAPILTLKDRFSYDKAREPRAAAGFRIVRPSPQTPHLLRPVTGGESKAMAPRPRVLDGAENGR